MAGLSHHVPRLLVTLLDQPTFYALLTYPVVRGTAGGGTASSSAGGGHVATPESLAALEQEFGIRQTCTIRIYTRGPNRGVQAVESTHALIAHLAEPTTQVYNLMPGS